MITHNWHLLPIRPKHYPVLYKNTGQGGCNNALHRFHENAVIPPDPYSRSRMHVHISEILPSTQGVHFLHVM